MNSINQNNSVFVMNNLKLFSHRVDQMLQKALFSIHYNNSFIVFCLSFQKESIKFQSHFLKVFLLVLVQGKNSLINCVFIKFLIDNVPRREIQSKIIKIKCILFLLKTNIFPKLFNFFFTEITLKNLIKT